MGVHKSGKPFGGLWQEAWEIEGMRGFHFCRNFWVSILGYCFHLATAVVWALLSFHASKSEFPYMWNTSVWSSTNWNVWVASSRHIGVLLFTLYQFLACRTNWVFYHPEKHIPLGPVHLVTCGGKYAFPSWKGINNSRVSHPPACRNSSKPELQFACMLHAASLFLTFLSHFRLYVMSLAQYWP